MATTMAYRWVLIPAGVLGVALGLVSRRVSADGVTLSRAVWPAGGARSRS